MTRAGRVIIFTWFTAMLFSGKIRQLDHYQKNEEMERARRQGRKTKEETLKENQDSPEIPDRGWKRTGRMAAVDHTRKEMNSCVIYTTVSSSYFRTDKSLCFCAVAEQARRDWEARLVRWEWELGLAPGPAVMCECLGQFRPWCPACRKFWNTPCCPSHSHSWSRSPPRYFHRVFKDGAMGVEECPLRCRSARLYMHFLLKSTLPCLNSPPSLPDAPPPPLDQNIHNIPTAPIPFSFNSERYNLPFYTQTGCRRSDAVRNASKCVRPVGFPMLVLAACRGSIQLVILVGIV